MQAKRHIAKLIKFPAKFPLVKNFRRQLNLDLIAVTKILNCFRTSRCGK